MRWLQTLWHDLRRTRRVVTLEEQARLLLDENRVQADIIAAINAMHRASRAEHDALLRRYNAVEADYAEVCGELADRREAARMWIERTIAPRVMEN